MMPNLDIDLTAIAAIWIVGMLVLVVLVAASLRLAIVPLLSAIASYRASGAGSTRELELRRRMQQMEGRLVDLERVVSRSTPSRPTAVS